MKKTLIAMCAALVVLASCHSSKKAAKDTTDIVASQTNTVSSLQGDGWSVGSNTAGGQTSAGGQVTTKAPAAAECLTGKLKVHFRQGDMDITTSGTLRMRRDDVIQVVLFDPFLGASEIGRLEVSPEEVLVIDRMNKRYATVRFDEHQEFGAYGLNFDVIQDYVWQQAKGSGQLNYTIPSRNAIMLDVKLSDIGSKSDWNGHTNVSDKYTKMSTEALMRMLK